MLQALNIETTLVENYGKLQKQVKKKNFVNDDDYKIIIAKLEVVLLKELSKLEKLILMGNNALNVVPEKNCDTKNILIYFTLKLKYIKFLKKT